MKSLVTGHTRTGRERGNHSIHLSRKVYFFKLILGFFSKSAPNKSRGNVNMVYHVERPLKSVYFFLPPHLFGLMFARK